MLLDGHKLVGISQRRTRHAARLQCCWYSAYDLGRLVELLVPDRRPPTTALASVATLPAALSDATVAALTASLNNSAALDVRRHGFRTVRDTKPGIADSLDDTNSECPDTKSESGGEDPVPPGGRRTRSFFFLSSAVRRTARALDVSAPDTARSRAPWCPLSDMQQSRPDTICNEGGCQG